jgi:hypothetical protein
MDEILRFQRANSKTAAYLDLMPRNAVALYIINVPRTVISLATFLRINKD